MKILSIDPGFGDCKVGYLDGLNSRPEYFKHTNTIAKLGPVKNNSNLGISEDDSKHIIEFNGEQYLIGSIANQATNSQVLTIKDYDALKEISPLIIKKYLMKYGEVDHIVVSLSLAYLEKSGDYKNYIVEAFNLDPKKVSLVPQGVGCKIALDKLGFDLNDPSFKVDCTNYLGIDIGFNTIDVIKVIDGVLITQNIQGFPGMGVTKIVNKIYDDLNNTNIPKDIPFSKIKNFLTQGYATIRGETHDLSGQIESRIKEYITELHEFLEKNYKEDLDSIDFLVIFGGGANLIKKYRSNWNQFYKEGFVKIPETGPEYYNALGGLYLPFVKKN